MSIWSRALLWAFVLLVGLFLVLPLLIVIPLSLTSGQSLQFPPPGYSTQWYEAFFEDEAWTSAAATSVQVSLMTTLLATTLGTCAALGVARSRTRLGRLLGGVFLTPMMVPTVITGLAMYSLFLDWQISGTYWGLVIADTVLAIPLVFVSVTAALASMDRTLENAAMSLGASPLTALRTVTLPLIAPGVATGAVFAFITAWDETVIAIFMSSAAVRPLPVEIWSGIRFEVDPTVAAVSVMLMVASGIAVLAWVLGERLRRRLQVAPLEGEGHA